MSLNIDFGPPPLDLISVVHRTRSLSPRWTIHMEGTDGTLYEGEKFQLLFKFNDKYPFDSPEVTFVGE